MAAATVAGNAPPPRAGTYVRPCFIPITITASATTYTTATGGLPFDLATFLNNLGPIDENGVNPSDLMGFIGYSTSGTIGLTAQAFAVGTVTRNAITDIANPNANQLGTLATCPCTLRLYNGTTETSDGALTAAISGWLLYSAGGHN